MARQNYQHGKRQRDLAKKQKREEKLAQKKERKKNPLGSPIEGIPEQPLDPDHPGGPLAGEPEDDSAEDSEEDSDDEPEDEAPA